MLMKKDLLQLNFLEKVNIDIENLPICQQVDKHGNMGNKQEKRELLQSSQNCSSIIVTEMWWDTGTFKDFCFARLVSGFGNM